jgi:uncharacterized membrane protein
VHSTAADVGLAVSSGRSLRRGRDVWLLSAGLAALRLVKRRRGDEVLDDRAVACKLEARGGCALGS